MIFSIIIFIITLLVLVLIHELGHFLVAKRFNIKVLEFGFGLPPKVWGKKFGETIFSLNWLPFGGFVKLLGEDEVDKKMLENHRSFAAQGVDKRILVVLAGVLMNLVFAWILFYIVLASQNFRYQIDLRVDHKFVFVSQKEEGVILITQVAENSPAQKGGLKRGERIIALNDELISEDERLVEKTKALAGEEIKLTLSDVEKTTFRDVKVTPRKNPPSGEGPLGISLAGFKIANLQYEGLLPKLFAGPIHSWNLTAYSGKVLGHLINQSFTEGTLKPISQSVAGPVGITSLANSILTSIEKPLIPYLNFMAILSLNLAVVNFLPIPALDGGRLFFLILEAVIRRRIHAEVERLIHTIGMALLLALTVIITFSDIQKILF